MILTRYRNQLLLTVLTCFIALATAAQSDKKYPSLLWEISGNGTEKSSYVYGTMHVSSKLAFHLGDSFFMALESCDYVALESDATTWLGHMFGTEYLEETGGLYRTATYHRDFYRDAFEVEEITKKQLAASLNFNNRIMNGMLYRKSSYAADYEEETYLDMYIHQAGKKLNKTLIGLEGFMESQRLVQKSNIPDDDEKDSPKNVEYRKLVQSGQSPREMLQDAYRNADLDMVDSLQRLINPSKNHQRYMLHERNANMVRRMDSIIQLGHTIFSGIGAAHLAGEKGVIEMLREKGYRVEPVMRNIGEYSKNYRDKLEKTFVDIDLMPYTTSDGWIEVKLPGELYEMPTNGHYKMYFYPDMSNGTNYSLTRVRHNGSLRNQSKEYILKRVDSLLYENIPGKILEQKSIERDGYPGFDIINRTKKSDYQRYLIFVTPLEVIVFKVGGTLDYVKDNNYLPEIFDSFKIKGRSSEWNTHKSPYGFSINLPGTPVTDEKNITYQHLFGNEVEILAMDGEDYFALKRVSYHDQSYIEEDTFELAYMANEFQDKMDYVEERRRFLEFKGLPALETVCKDTGNTIYTLYFIDGPRYYQLLSYRQDSTRPNTFFESFQFSDYKPIRNYFDVADTSYYYTVKSNTRRAGYRAFDIREIKERIENKENDRNYDGRWKTLYYGDVMADEEVYVYFKQHSRYYYEPNYDSLWNYYRTLKTDNGFLVESEKISADSNVFEMVVADTNSRRKIMHKYISNDGTLYCLKYIKDQAGKSTFGETFFNTFKPQADTVIGLPFNQNKGDLFLSDLWGEDSLAKDYALKSISEDEYALYSLDFDASHLDRLIYTFEAFEHKEFGINERAALLEHLGGVKDARVLPYLDKVYKRSIDTAVFQLSVLRALVGQETKSATRMIGELLDYETPLVSESSISGLLTYRMSDSLELYDDLFPFLLKLTRYPEYRTSVYTLMATMLDSNIIKPKLYKKYRKDMVREAKDVLKRIMASANEDNDSYFEYMSSGAGSNIDLLQAYNTLLSPFKKNSDVADYFERTKRLNSDEELLASSLQLLKAGIEVNDTIWPYFANHYKYFLDVYHGLHTLNRLDLIPDTSLSQVNIAKALLYSQTKLEDEDSVKFLKRYKARSKHGEGYIYVFKKKDKYNDAEWNFDYVGVLPLDSTEVPEYYDIGTRKKNSDYLDDEDMDEKIEEVVENILYADRKRVKKKRKRSNYYGY